MDATSRYPSQYSLITAKGKIEWYFFSPAYVDSLGVEHDAVNDRVSRDATKEEIEASRLEL